MFCVEITARLYPIYLIFLQCVWPWYQAYSNNKGELQLTNIRHQCPKWYSADLDRLLSDPCMLYWFNIRDFYIIFKTITIPIGPFTLDLRHTHVINTSESTIARQLNQRKQSINGRADETKQLCPCS